MSSLLGQSSLDILNAPNNAQAAGLGITNNPIIKPTRSLTHPEKQVDLSVWNWVADIQGGIMGLALENSYVGFRTMQIGNIEYRGDIPTEEPLSTFGYSLLNIGASHARNLGQIKVGAGIEYLYERTLNASANGLSFNLAAAYPLSDSLRLSAGVSHLGFAEKLENESTTFPTELWVEVDWKLSRVELLAEVTTGDVPLTLGAIIPVLESFEFLGGVQIESSNSDISVHPSVGFASDWDNFRLGYSLYQFTHALGPRHFISLYWKY